MLRFETLGAISRKQAGDVLTQRIVAASTKPIVPRMTLTFRELVNRWEVTVLPMFKHSTQKHRRFFAKKHLLPRFGELYLTAVTRQEIQAYVTHLTLAGYAPKSVDNIHDTLSAILRSAMEWGYLLENPAKGVRLPKLRTVRSKWVLTATQAAGLLRALAVLPRSLVGLALATGLRRGEVFALRWKDVDMQARVLTVREAVYEGMFGTPKTEAGSRRIPLSSATIQLMGAWKAQQPTAGPEALVFATYRGTSLSPNNVLRRSIFPACDALGLPHATWLTFRRTYSTWAHERGVPSKIVAQLLGHANVDTTLNVYTQVLEGSVRDAVETVGEELFTIVHSAGETAPLIH